jgi:hypothetical protein
MANKKLINITVEVEEELEDNYLTIRVNGEPIASIEFVGKYKVKNYK